MFKYIKFKFIIRKFGSLRSRTLSWDFNITHCCRFKSLILHTWNFYFSIIVASTKQNNQSQYLTFIHFNVPGFELKPTKKEFETLTLQTLLQIQKPGQYQFLHECVADYLENPNAGLEDDGEYIYSTYAS